MFLNKKILYLYFQVETAASKELYAEYVLVYEKFKTRRKEIVTTRLELISELKAKTYRSLNDAGQIRSRMIRECHKIGCSDQAIFSDDNFLDLIREIKLVPLKISSGVLSKILEKDTISKSRNGKILLKDTIVNIYNENGTIAKKIIIDSVKMNIVAGKI